MGTLDTEQAARPRVESVLRDELVRGDKALGGVAPVLSHLLASPGFSLVSEAIVARLRGMLGDLARQLLIAADGQGAVAMPARQEIERFADHLAQDSAILSHLYATAMEGQFALRLEARQSIDPVLSPLLQELIASERPAMAELAMSAMAAQSRFIQSQRRMEHPVGELPAELFNLVLRRSVGYVRDNGSSGSPAAVQALKRRYDESTTRTGILGRIVTAMDGGARAALRVEHAGMALFASGVAHFTGQPRELAVLACHERQGARLAVSLRAAGLDEAEIRRQFALFDPAETVPARLDDVSPERARAMLSHASAPGLS